MTKPPRFSILIPTSGRAHLIRMAVESVLTQTFRDFELIVVDSSGSEEAKEATLYSDDARVRYVESPKSPPLITWDFAARQATGEYVMWCDDDNFLLPFALDLFDRTIRNTSAEVITASHFYYYDDRHPRLFLRNSVGVVPWNGSVQAIDLSSALREIFGFSRRGPGQKYPRFHFSATVFSRQILERAFARLGFVMIAEMPNIHSLQPILFAFAKSSFFVDIPMVIVGRLGVSMSQIWSTAARARFKKRPFIAQLSPVKGYTRMNGILENYLRTKKLLPDLLGDIPIGYERFAEQYVSELFYLDTGVVAALRNWKELFAFLKTLNAGYQKVLAARAKKYMFLWPFLNLIRRMRLHIVWRMLYGVCIRRKEDKRSAVQKFQGNKEFVIPFDKKYPSLRSLSLLGRHIEKIVQDELGIHLQEQAARLFPGSRGEGVTLGQK
ncbi:MAG: glycosyl transferase family protein [Parcubacteria group bacterium Gr01-1014_33]|nr:MAG: glycosyl transferase family protein [Parcubacteria group bacterium Gr01-1014_33]